MSDIKRFGVEETSVVALLGADDAPLVGDDSKPLTITVYGPGSKPYVQATTAQQNRMIDRLKRKGKSDLTAEEKTREQAEFLASCTKAFSPNIEYDDLKDEALFKAVYSDASLGFIAEQVGKAIIDWAVFTKGSPTS